MCLQILQIQLLHAGTKLREGPNAHKVSQDYHLATILGLDAPCSTISWALMHHMANAPYEYEAQCLWYRKSLPDMEHSPNIMIDQHLPECR